MRRSCSIARAQVSRVYVHSGFYSKGGGGGFCSSCFHIWGGGGGGGRGGGINRADTLYIPPQLSCMIYMYVHIAASLLPIFNVIFLFLFFFFISSDSIVFARLNKESQPLMKTTLKHLAVSSVKRTSS